MTRAAIIDMGTNTFHLLVAAWDSSGYQIIGHESLPVRIGAGGINQNRISEEATERAVKALLSFKRKAKEWGADSILAFGTSALRNAIHADEIIQKIKEATGIHPQVISGEEEAALIYEGVNLALQLGEEKNLIVDIGGGSVEFIIANGKKIFVKQSFEIGGLRLMEQYQKHDPILQAEIELIYLHLENSLKPLLQQLKIHQPKILAGSSGAFDTLSAIYCARQGLQIKDTPEIPFAVSSFQNIYQEIISKNRKERMLIPGMIELRVDMMAVACCLIRFILQQSPFEQMRVSSFSLKEGVLASLMKDSNASSGINPYISAFKKLTNE